jgi:hypothetical protein
VHRRAFAVAIALSAVCSGITTYAEYEHNTVLAVFGTFSTVVFFIETALKFVAESQSWGAIGGYFSDHWYVLVLDFDAIISANQQQWVERADTNALT